MSGNFFVDFIFLFLICYAVFCMFYNLSEFLMKRYCKYPARYFFVLSLSHGSETLECDIGCALSRSLKEKCALLIVCNDLSSDEYKTLWRITDVYEHIVLTTPEKLTGVLDKASYISEML